MKGIFNTNLAKVSNKYIARRDKLSVGELFLENYIIKNVYAELFEQLLLFDKVSISLGPMDNTAIAALAIGFNNIKELERALDLEAIEILMPQTLTVVNSGPFGRGEKDPSLLWGQPPIVAGRMLQKDLGDPESAVLDGLKFVRKFNDSEKRRLSKKIANSLKLGPVNNDAQAIDMVLDAYNNNLLRTVGMPYEGHPYSLNLDSRLRLQGFVAELDNALLIAENDYAIYGSPQIYNIMKDSISRIEEGLDVQKSTDFLLESLQLPNLRLLFVKPDVSLEHAMSIRESGVGAEFRKWIYDNSNPIERKGLIKRYADAIDKPTGFSTRLGGELFKGVTTNVFGKIPAAGATIVGTSIGGIVGGVPGAAIGAGLGFAIEVGGGLLIDKLVGPFFKGFTPKLFVNKIEQLNKESNEGKKVV
jgi:hypothetical protein